MATGGKLEVQIGADITDFEKKIKEVEYDIKELSKVKLEKIKLGLDTREINAQIKDAKNNLTGLRTAIKDTGGQIGGQFTKQVGNGNNALIQFGRIAQDAPYGIIGIGNNLTATAESFGYLKQQTGSTGGALKALASSLTGTGGILLGVSLLTAGFTFLSQSGLSLGDVFNKITGNVDVFKDALKKANEEAYNDKGVQAAVSNVNELRNEIDLAKNGFLDKDKVVEHYNETIGKTTGLVSSLDEAEKEITKNGDAYIRMTLYKAAANIALEEAAKASLEAERSRVKKLSEFTSAFLDADLTVTRSKEQYEQKQKNLQNQLKLRQKEEIKVNQVAANANISIAKKFQSDAAKIAKDFKFNFFGDTKPDKVKKAPKNFDTPQVSALKTSIIPAPLIDLAGIAVFNGQIDAFGNKIKELPGIIKTSMAFVSGSIVTPLSAEMIRATEAMVLFNENVNAIIQDSVVSTFGNLGTIIGESLASGADVLSAVGNSLMQSLGGLLSMLGDELIKLGTAAVLAGTVVKLFGTIAGVGAGLLAIAGGVALKGIGAGLGQKANDKSNSVNSNSGGSNSNFSSSTGGFSSSGSGNGTVVFEIAGQKLIGVLSNTLNANRRLGGKTNLGI